MIFFNMNFLIGFHVVLLYSNYFELKTMLAVVQRLFTGEVVVSSVTCCCCFGIPNTSTMSAHVIHAEYT